MSRSTAATSRAGSSRRRRRSGRAAPARHRDPRRPAHALRLVADPRVPGPRRRRDQRLLLATRAAPRATAATFNEANLRDWGPGPMRDVIAGIDALVADGLADPDRLGVTGGSYGGYLTNWIVAHDQRFRAAITCRSVSDMAMLFLTGDISGGDWAKLEFGVDALGRPGLLPRDLAAHATPTGSGRRCSSSTASATSGRRSARPRRCSRSSARRSGRSGSCACPTRPTS